MFPFSRFFYLFGTIINIGNLLIIVVHPGDDMFICMLGFILASIGSSICLLAFIDSTIDSNKNK